MRWAHSLRGRLTLAMLLVFILGLLVSAAFSTREARQEAVLSTTEMLREERMDQQDARGALIGIFLDEAIDWLLCSCPWPWPRSPSSG